MPKTIKESFTVFNSFPNLHYGLSRRWHGSMNRNLIVNGMNIGVRNRYEFLEHREIKFGIPTYSPIQVHGTTVLTITNENLRPEKEADGCITNYPFCLLVSMADCIPLYAFDPKTRSIALAHCGWKGTYDNIAMNVITAMGDLGARASDIHVALGPAIDVCHFVVSRELGDRFSQINLYRDFVHPEDKKHCRIDLKGIVRRQCKEANVLPEHIEVSRACTYCMKNTLFSHRADKSDPIKTMLAYIYISAS